MSDHAPRLNLSQPQMDFLEPRLLLTTYNIPTTIPYDYSRDVTADLQAFINSVPDGNTIAFPVLSYNATTVGYKVEGTLKINTRNNLYFEGNGAFIRAFDPLLSTDPNVRTRSQWQVDLSSTNTTFHNMTIYGADTTHVYDSVREAQHAFNIVGAANGVLIDSVNMYETYGDGVYIGGSNSTQNITVQNSHVQYPGRQGMSPCRGNNILIQNNWIGDSARGLIDIEPYAAGWLVDNVRIINNTFGTSHLLALPMGGGGDYGTVMISGTNDTGTHGTPEIDFHRSAAPSRRGAFICVNNKFNVGGSPSPGIWLQPVDGDLIAGNDLTFPLSRYMTAVTLADSDGAVIGNNLFQDAQTMVSADAASLPLMQFTNTPTRTGWTRQTVVTEFGTDPGCFYATVPYGDGGQVIAIWRAGTSAAALSYGGLTTTGDYAIVRVTSGGALVDGWALNGTASYNSAPLGLLWGTPAVSIAATDANAAEQGQDPGTFTVSRTTRTGALVVNYTIGGTAVAADYTPTLSGTVTIPDGQASANIVITPVDDTTSEPAETVILTLATGTGYTVGTPTNATVTIADNDGISETWTGSNGAAWPACWTFTGGALTTKDIQNNTGRIYCASGGAKAVAYNTTLAFQDSTQLVSMESSSNGPMLGLNARIVAADDDTKYAFETDMTGAYANSNKIYLKRYVDNVATTLATYTLSYNVTSGVWYNLAFYCVQNGSSTDLKGKIWPTGQADPGWLMTASDNNARLQNLSGYGGLYLYPSGNRYIYSDNYSATSGGGMFLMSQGGSSSAAPQGLAAPMSAPSAKVLMQPTAPTAAKAATPVRPSIVAAASQAPSKGLVFAAATRSHASSVSAVADPLDILSVLSIL